MVMLMLMLVVMMTIMLAILFRLTTQTPMLIGAGVWLRWPERHNRRQPRHDCGCFQMYDRIGNGSVTSVDVGDEHDDAVDCS